MDLDTLYDAAMAGDADAIAKLEMEADKVNKHGETMLHLESKKGNTERVRFILSEFASKNLLVKLGNQQETALAWAAYMGHTEVVEVLIDAARHLPPPPTANDNSVTSFQAFLRHADQDLETALHIAVMYNKIAIVKLLVEADPGDTHIQNREGKTPMYIAVEQEFNDIVEIISTICTAPSLDGPYGSTVMPIKNLEQGTSPGGMLYKIIDRYALYVAAIGGDADAIAILEKQADILHRGEETIHHIESKNRYAERVRPILREFAKKDLLTTLTSKEQTSLHLAAIHGHTEVAEILIDAARNIPPSNDDNPVTSFQAFLRQGDYEADTALHAAVKKGHASIVKLLVEADPTHTHTQNYKGKTPMYIAVENGYNDIVEIISTTCTAPSLNGPDGSTAVRIKNLDQATSPGVALYKIMDKDDLYDAAIAGDADAIAVLEMQADKLNEYDRTILHIESKNGYTERVRFILSEFASKNLLVKLGNQQETALAWAAYMGHTEVVEVLIDAARHLPLPSSANDNSVTSFQAFLRHADQDLETALYAAVKEGHVDIAKMLLEADPGDKHIQNKDGKTPIYIAAENGYHDIVKLICITCTSQLNLDGPGGSTALHAAIKNLHKATNEDRDVIRSIIEAVKRANNLEKVDERDEKLIKFFNKTDENRCIILELAVEANYLDVVKLILEHNPAYRLNQYPDFIGIMPLIYRAMDKENNDMVNLLTETYQKGVQNVSKFSRFAKMPQLISALDSGDEESVLRMLNHYACAKDLVTFADILGWTALHHATYYEYYSIIGKIIEAQKKCRHPFVYQDMVSTPFHIAVEKGNTSILKLLLELWPSSSSAYTSIDKNGQNILHLAALPSKKEMMQWILKICPGEYKKEFVNRRDRNGNTPLHLLIWHGCFVPELLRYEGLDIWVENKKRWTPPDMLYSQDQVIDDQVQIKLALDAIQFDRARDILSSNVLPSKRMKKDAILHKEAKLMIRKKYEHMNEDADAIEDCFDDAIAGDVISKAALEMKADKLNESGETILHVESKKGGIENVQFIVSVLASKRLLGKLDRSKQTALHHAAKHVDTRVVKALIDAAKVNLPSSSANDDANNPDSSFQDFIRQANVPDRNTALHLAVLNGNVALVKLLVEADPNDSHIQNSKGKTPIYIAAEKGYKDIVKEICTTCTALSLDGPGGRMTALHALIRNINQVTEGANDMIRMMIHTARSWSSAEDPSLVKFKKLFSRKDSSGTTILELAMERNYVEGVKLILMEDPAYQYDREIKRNNLMHLIYKAIDNNYNDDIVNSLSETYKAGIDSAQKDVLDLILAIKKRDEDSVSRLLGKTKNLVIFAEDNGWTPLHYAVYHEFNSILGTIIDAQEQVGHPFVYENMVSTPFHVAAKHGYTSTLIRLIQSWTPTQKRLMQLRPAHCGVTAANSPYTGVDEIVRRNSPYTGVDESGRNILHLAAACNNKEMIQAILKYCPDEMYKDEILKQKDEAGDTPLHLLISHGCFIHELMSNYKRFDTIVIARNNKGWTPQDMLYFQDDIIEDQAQIKNALDDMKNMLAELKEEDIWEGSLVLPSRRERKDVLFDEYNKSLMEEEKKEKKKELQIYRQGTNSQIVVSALITTITFTVGFTMPGGLHESGGVDEGMAVLSKKAAFNAFMVLDALALLLSSCSMFIYFLESMYDDPYQVFSLSATTTVLNIVSVILMMLIFITGTYVVLSHTPALAITVCVIGSLFFLFVIVQLMKFVLRRGQKKRN